MLEQREKYLLDNLFRIVIKQAERIKVTEQTAAGLFKVTQDFPLKRAVFCRRVCRGLGQQPGMDHQI